MMHPHNVTRHIPSPVHAQSGKKRSSSDQLNSLLSTPADCEELAVTYRAELLCLCRAHAANLHASRVRVDKVEYAALEAVYTDVSGCAPFAVEGPSREANGGRRKGEAD